MSGEMDLIASDFKLFQQGSLQFEKLKQDYTLDEIDELKAQFKILWDKWKSINLAAYEELKATTFLAKPKIESWTNGWQIRGHYWVSYRGAERGEDATCIGVLLNRETIRINLLWQQYKKKNSTTSIVEYNQRLQLLEKWATTVDVSDYYLWRNSQSEYDTYLPLTEYLENNQVKAEFQRSLVGEAFQIGRVISKGERHTAVDQLISKTILELESLYWGSL